MSLTTATPPSTTNAQPPTTRRTSTPRTPAGPNTGTLRPKRQPRRERGSLTAIPHDRSVRDPKRLKTPQRLVVAALGAKPAALAVFVLAVAVAAYTGFRLPNDWTATLDAVSITEGFHRRILVGTLLHPLAVATHDNYWVFAVKSYLVLAALLAVATVALIRTKLVSHRLLLIGWLLLPTGGYFFHEVGYYDQVLYLVLFAGVLALDRSRPIVASVLMTLSVLVHEITVLTALPIFAMVAVRRLPFGRAVLVLVAPMVLSGIVLVAVHPSAPGSTARLGAVLAHANFPYRADALALFDRTQDRSWQLYNVGDVLIYLAPSAILMILAFALLHLTDAGLTDPANGRTDNAKLVSVLHALVAAVAVTSPLLLAFAGWDQDRWGFLLVTNFAIVLWLHLRERQRELGMTQVVILVATMLIVTHIPMGYFDGFAPRPLQWPAMQAFLGDLVHGKAFTIPLR